MGTRQFARVSSEPIDGEPCCSAARPVEGDGQFQWSLHGEGSIEFCWALVVEAAAAG